MSESICPDCKKAVKFHHIGEVERGTYFVTCWCNNGCPNNAEGLGATEDEAYADFVKTTNEHAA